MVSAWNKVIGLAILLIGLLMPSGVWGCNIPVFRYALEQWTPDDFVVVIFYREPLTAGQKDLVGTLQKARELGTANLRVCQIDVTKGMSGPFQALWKGQVKPTLPWVVVRYPAQSGIDLSVWAGPLSAESLSSLGESPARSEIARRLLRGDSVVWLLVEGEDPKQNDLLARRLTDASQELERTLTLPTPAPDDPQINPDLPLKIAFSMVRVSRSDPAENLLVSQLVNWEPRLRKTTQPLLFPVFGRGRVLPPAVGEGIQVGAIGAMARLLTGPCSCQIKEMNAGFDLLLGAKWDELLSGHTMNPGKLPPLIGISQFISNTTKGPASVLSASEISLAQIKPVKERNSPHRVVHNVILAMAIGVVVVGSVALALVSKARRANE